MGPSGGLMLDGDLLAYSSMAICPFTGLFLVAIHSGRLPLAQCSALTGAKLELFDPFVAEAVPWAQREGFVVQSADGTLIGPFNPLLESPEIAASFLDWSHAAGRYA